ncbi:unnamed protein product [Menidia menidia]|uniref:(Atlantic silverside) hypothetical protein n=1 Tax=Menidia menidia TaxID=238744 RepID=A0A8S4B1Z4_9TELE|nr:unnamed protein product [Menidia menidia]
MSDPEKFLKSLSEDNKMKTVRNSFGPEEINLQVVESSLSLMPYESHLQFFVWKEMLQVVQPRAERLTFTSQGPAITVSADGRSLVSACQQNHYPPPERAQNEFSSGQHYWEIDVGQKAYWELGVNQNFLKHNGSTYTLCKNNRARPVTIVHPSAGGAELEAGAMASGWFSEDLTCSVCLTLFTDPVTLPCGHSFCRLCVAEELKTCPHQSERSVEQCCLFRSSPEANQAALVTD